MKWKLILLLTCVLGYLQYALWFGKNNMSDFHQVQQVLVEMQAQNSTLKLRNDRMYAETADLYNGLDAIEDRARSNLGMIKPNEHFYRVISDAEQN
ncbi:cell division protein FtsB [Utexia brackfieldae]|uniref:cell division protein FtsB n=1 Tax=Utexia brackfieldae TaxID=3074108 RepID=UPI00370D9C77